jgi:S-adenosyl methyltransferase
MTDEADRGTTQKPATAARMYDYYLGGIYNFEADRSAARQVVSQFPFVPAMARANRAFLARAVRYLLGAGVQQLLDVGSGIPTAGNVHEIAAAVAPGTRVVYVDLDPVAVAESQEILKGSEEAGAILADLRRPETIVTHPTVARLLRLDRPVGLLLAAVLHFLPEDDQAYGAVTRLLDALPPGSYLVVSHTATETFGPIFERDGGEDTYRNQTSTPGTLRTRAEVERFFAGLDLVEPGVVWVSEWRPDADADADAMPPGTPYGGAMWAGIGRKS